MKIYVYGMNYNCNSIDDLEKITFTNSLKNKLYNHVNDNNDIIDSLIILSTCNRSELIFSTSDLDKALLFLQDFYKNEMNFNEFGKFFIEKDQNALKYLFESVSGFNSLVLGEDQIQGQIKDAYNQAMEYTNLNQDFHKLMQLVLACGKQVRTKYKISEFPLSLSYLGINVLKENHNDLNDMTMLIVGLGKMNKLILKYALELNLKKIYIANRSEIDTTNLNLDNRVQLISFDQRFDVLDECDVVVSATAAPHLVFDNERYDFVNKQLIFLDLALPRDVEKNDRHIIYDVHALKEIAKANNEKRLEAKANAQELIDTYINDYLQWDKNKAIYHLKNKINKSQQLEMDKTISYLSKKLKLDESQHYLLEKTLHKHLVNHAHKIVSNISEYEEEKKENYMDMLHELYKGENKYE